MCRLPYSPLSSMPTRGRERLFLGLLSLGVLCQTALAGGGPGPAAMEIRYSGGLLTVQADQTPLAAVLGRVAAITGIKIQIDPGFNSAVSHWAIRDLPLEEALLQLARPHNVLIFHGAQGSSAPVGQIVAVHVLAPQFPQSHETGLTSDQPAAKPLAPTARDLVQVIQTSGDWFQRQQAITALSAMPIDEARPGLESALAVPEPVLRQDIVRVLGTLYGETPPTVLGQVVMGDGNAHVRLAALQALAGINTPIARQFIQQALRDPEEFIQVIAKEILGRLDTP